MLNEPIRENAGEKLPEKMTAKEREKAREAQGLNKLSNEQQPNAKKLSLKYVLQPKVTTQSQLLSQRK